MSSLQTLYTKILDTLHAIEPNDCFLDQRRTPKMTDKELIALSLAAEALSIDSERHLFRLLPQFLAVKIDRSVYNRRRKNLQVKLEALRQSMVNRLDSGDYYLVDSMPLEVCKISRAARSKLEQDNDTITPDYGYCAAQNTHYFGYKIHAACTDTGIFKTFDISKASTHDVHYLNDLKQHLHHCVLIGDKGYISQTYQADLFTSSNIRLHTPTRKNQHVAKPFPYVFRKARKRIETLFSQLCDQFMIRRNYAKSFSGFATRVATKITALTLLQFINIQEGKHVHNVNRLH